MKNIFIFFIILLFSKAAFATCNLNNIELGKKFNSLKKKFDFDNDFYGDDKFYKNTDGSMICRELNADTKVSFLFIDNTLARIEIDNDSNDDVLLKIASTSFGTPKTLPNKNNSELKTFSTFWENKDNIASYNFQYSSDKKIFREKLVIQQKEYSEEIRALTSSKEQY